MGHIMRVKIFLLLSLFISPLYAAYPGMLDKNVSSETQWIFNRANACLQSDNINHVAADGECLALQTYYANSVPDKNPILLVFIHGDGIPGGGPSDYLKFQATKFSAPDVVPVVLIRPGYYDSYGNYSTGESYAFSGHGYPNDSYRPHTVATLAAAVQSLKNYYQPRCTILVGHSGGGMMSGVILGKYPGLADGAVLASVVGDVQQWSTKHGYGDYPHSLSPNNFVDKIPTKDFVYIISGTNDTNTYPEMSKAYYNQLKNHGVQVYWRVAKDGTHNSVTSSQPQVFDQAITDAIKQCPV